MDGTWDSEKEGSWDSETEGKWDSEATPVKSVAAPTPTPTHDWGTTDARDKMAEQKTTRTEDLLRGAKNLAQSKVTKSSMAAAGLSEISDRSFFGIAGKILRDKLGLPNPTKDQIFSNMDEINKAIEEGTDTGDKKKRGLGGNVIAAGPALLDTIAQGMGSTAATATAAGVESFIGHSTDIAKDTSTAAPAILGGVVRGTLDAAAMALPGGKGLVKGAAIGAGSNVASGAVGDYAVKQMLEQMWEFDAAKKYDPLDPEKRKTEAVLGLIAGGVVGRYASHAENKALKDSQEAYAQLTKELDDISATEGAAKAFADAKASANTAADAASPNMPKPNKANIKENDAYAKEQGWTGQEPGMGKGEILEDVDASMRKNPYLNDEQAFGAQRNELQGKGPAYGEMGFAFPEDGAPVFPTAPDAALDKAIKSAARSANAKAPLEKAQAKADAAADLIASDLIMAENGVPPDQSEGARTALADAAEVKNKTELFNNFLNVARKKQGGHLDLTGLGDNALVQAAEKFSKKAAETIKKMPARLGRMKYWLGDNPFPWTVDSKTGVPYIFYHGTVKQEGGNTPWNSGPESTQAFQEFMRGDIGFHIGSIVSAERFTLQGNQNPGGKAGYVIPVYTNIKNPFMMRDLGGWNPLQIIEELTRVDSAVNKFGGASSTIGDAPGVQQASILNRPLSGGAKESLEVIKHQLINRGGDVRDAYAQIRSILKREGYDSIAYQNTAEIYSSYTNKDKSGDTTPNFSYILFEPHQAKSVFSKAFDPRTNKMSGYLDLDVVKESAQKVAKLLKVPFNKLFSSDNEIATKANHNVFDSADELLSTYKPDETPDLAARGKNIPTVNQLKLMMDHPWFNYAFGKIGQAKREANVRFVMYADALKDVFELKRPEQLKLFKTLTDIQSPELLEARRKAEATNTREQFLIEQGMDPALVPKAIKVLNVLKHAFLADNDSTIRVQRNPFEQEPMYFPRAHTGKFNVTIRTSANDVKYATGFDSGVEAQKFAKNLTDSYKKQIDAGELFIEAHRNHYGQSSDIFSVMALEQAVPKSIKDIASGIEKSIEVAKRTFELHRAKEGVGGFIGERLMNESTLSGRLENDKLLNMLQNRLRSSHDWEVRSKLIEQVKTPLIDDMTVAHDKPEFRLFVGQLLMRELGHDIGANRIERGMQKGVEDASKAIDKYFWGRVKGYEGGDLALVGPKALQESAQAWTYITSLWKLSLNPPVLAANATAMPLVFMDGARTAAKQKVGMHNAITAYYDTLAYIGHKDQAATKFMQEAMKEGMVEPHISEQYDLAETRGHNTETAIDKWSNMARNQIEKGTNFTAILYYYNYYKRVAPNLKPEALKQMVYESARSYSGDYSLQAGPLMFSQAGSAGRLMTNFAKWKWNQIGRFADDLKDAKNGNMLPIAVNMATQVLVGGAYGAAFAVDYEALRRLGKLTTLWDWKPFSAFFDDAQDGMKDKLGVDPASTEWIRRGALNQGLAKAADALGFATSPDLSGTMRHSSALEAPTVALTMAKDLFIDALPEGAKWLWQIAGGKTTGISSEGKEKVISGFPTVMQGGLRHAMAVNDKFGKLSMENLSNPGEIITHSKFNDKGIYKRDQQEQKMSILNFRSAKENNYSDKMFYNTWLKQDRAKQITERVKGILENQDNPELFMNNIDELATMGGAQTVRNIIKQIKTNEVNKSLTADEQAAFALLQTLDPTRKRFMLEQMNRLLESQPASSGR